MWKEGELVAQTRVGINYSYVYMLCILHLHANFLSTSTKAITTGNININSKELQVISGLCQEAIEILAVNSVVHSNMIV